MHKTYSTVLLFTCINVRTQITAELDLAVPLAVRKMDSHHQVLKLRTLG